MWVRPSSSRSLPYLGQTVIIPSEELGIVHPLRKIHKPFSSDAEDFFPFLLCNVGTGVSILHVESETHYTRVSGTALGGGTFLGLTRLLTDARQFQEALDVAVSGDARRVDMLVADIYGADTERSGLKLPGDLTASFFAKNISAARGADPREHVKDDDICKALVVMIAQNFAQIAHLNARIHGLRRVFFTGNFLRNNDLALRTIVYTMNRWCAHVAWPGPHACTHAPCGPLLRGEPRWRARAPLPRPPARSGCPRSLAPSRVPCPSVRRSQLDASQLDTEAVFFRHEGYFGAIGAFLQTLEAEVVRDCCFSAPPPSCEPAA